MTRLPVEFDIVMNSVERLDKCANVGAFDEGARGSGKLAKYSATLKSERPANRYPSVEVILAREGAYRWDTVTTRPATIAN
jgi:hypothetical protein